MLQHGLAGMEVGAGPSVDFVSFTASLDDALFKSPKEALTAGIAASTDQPGLPRLYGCHVLPVKKLHGASGEKTRFKNCGTCFLTSFFFHESSSLWKGTRQCSLLVDRSGCCIMGGPVIQGLWRGVFSHLFGWGWNLSKWEAGGQGDLALHAG